MRHFALCFLILSSLCLLTVNGMSLFFPPAEHTDYDAANEMEEKWAQFKAQYNKQYPTNSLDEYHRRLIWEANQRYIDQHNAEYEDGLHTYTLGMNAFGDLTQREFADNHLTRVSEEDLKRIEETTSLYMSPLSGLGPVPDEIDWRTKGMVTPVKDQGQCGSCWAFSSTGALEGQYFRKASKLVSFSEQQLVDCSTQEGNQGCNGGLMSNAFVYVQKSGIETEDDYPYKARDGRCAFNSTKVVTKITGKVLIPRDENKLQEASATVGPISVAIDASQSSFQFYKSGIYNERACSSTQLDHAVLLIGYGLDGAQKVPFWLVKNSWGTGWGEQGYIRMSRNKHNQCGIATMAIYPQI